MAKPAGRRSRRDATGRRFEAFVAAHIPSLPPDLDARLCYWVSDLLRRGVGVQSVARYVADVKGYLLNVRGLSLGIDSAAVARVLRRGSAFVDPKRAVPAAAHSVNSFLVSGPSPSEAAFVAVQRATALRVEGMQKLRWQDVSPRHSPLGIGGVVHVRVDLKSDPGGVGRYLPIPPHLFVFWLRYSMSPEGVDRRRRGLLPFEHAYSVWLKVMKRVDPYYSGHSNRRGALQALNAMGIATVDRLYIGGHASERGQERYLGGPLDAPMSRRMDFVAQ
eukprot:gene44047-46010_t